MQIGFYFDQTRCTGCYTCVIACKDWHDVPAGPASWRRMVTIEKGTYPNVFVAFLTTACYHCLKPACVDACPVNAITKREQDGIVLVDKETCISCQLCLEACPYHAPQFGAEADAKMQKCTLCFKRVAENKKPICVDACPVQALDAGPMEELRAKYGDIQQAEGFTYSAELGPSVIFKPKKDTQALPIKKIVIAPCSQP
jgi:anaerobic dimethyl sulfoxide reductase subunit B (iron-sulfur subunit)